MKLVWNSFARFFAALLLLAPSSFLLAGPEAIPSSDKEMKQVAAVPVSCDWRGFYLGLNAGGQFGQSEDTDLDGYNANANRGQNWKYGEFGFSGGAQMGFNWQWHSLVLGPEVDAGYMNLHGHGVQPVSPGDDTSGKNDSDFFTTFRGRLGFALDHWLFYATGGGIAVNETVRVVDNDVTPPAGPAVIDARQTDFALGYTVGGGIERMIGCHWSVRAEYLYFNLASESFSGQSVSIVTPGVTTYDWRADTTGHIFRLGLNYRF